MTNTGVTLADADANVTFKVEKLCAHLSLEMIVNVHEDQTRDLNQRDDEGAFGQRAQVVTEGTQHRRQNGSQRHLGFISERREVK